MNNLTHNNTLMAIVLVALTVLLTSCGGSGDPGDSDVSQIESNPEFLAKSKAVDFNRVRLYEGHVKPENISRKAELDTSSLSSGDLITIDVEFEITGDLKDYSVSALLVPQSIFSLLDTGTTIGEIINDNVDSQQGEGIVDFDGAYVDEIKPGILHGVIHARLPVLTQNTVYKVAVLPSLRFLTAGKEINQTDFLSVPVLLDERELNVSKLDRVSVKIIDAPDLTVDNDFTELEIGGEFDSNGFSVEPVFQTSIEVDVTSFNGLEEVVLSLSWAHPTGATLPLGLLSSDADGNPVISTRSRHVVIMNGVTTATIPVVAYAPIKTHTDLLKLATNIENIADQNVQTGEFDLEIFFEENGEEVSAGNAYRLSIPLVSQNNRVLQQDAAEAIGFAVLRAGNTNAACLGVIPDIDTDLILSDSTSLINIATCLAQPPDGMLWRYDTATKQFINKVKDFEGNNYCITAINKEIVALPGSSSSTLTDIRVKKCIQPGPFVFNPLTTQKFDFEGNKLKSTKGYLQVNSIVTVTSDSLDATDFFRNANGLDINQSGRLFYVGKFYDRSWGASDLAQIGLNYGGESFVDYMPVLGTTTQGHATLSASLFGASADLLDTSFALKRYFPKKLSVAGNNAPNVVVGNGAELKISVAGFDALDLGGIVEKTISENFNPADEVGDVLAGVPGINDLDTTPIQFRMNEEFVSTTIIVAVVPVTISGGIDGDVNINMKLTSPGIGFDVAVTENLALDGFLNAKIDAIVVAGGIEATLEAINQSLDFSANGGFNTNPLTPTKLSFDIGSALEAELKLLKGEVSAFVEYRKICLCRSVGKKVKKEKVLYSSDYLFNDNWTIYSSQINSTVIDY